MTLLEESVACLKISPPQAQKSGDIASTGPQSDGDPVTKVAKPDGPKCSEPFQFGSRVLSADDDPLEFNAWDHVEIDEEYAEFARAQIEKQRARPVTDFDKSRFMDNPAKWWDIFYKNNRENFFKDRKWLQQEFPVLSSAIAPDAGPKLVVELGCGAGNTLFPVVSHNQNSMFRIHGCDFSPKAVELVKSQPLYAQHHAKGAVVASVYDLAALNTLPDGIEPGSVDVVIMVFILSALAPQQWVHAIRNVRNMLKKGGLVLLRDYGRNDLAQIRFKGSRYLQENFYVRGDGTRVYFFDERELEHIFARDVDGTSEVVNDDVSDGYGGFSIQQLAVDKRMLVNRKRQIKMYRRWVQGVFKKL